MFSGKARAVGVACKIDVKQLSWNNPQSETLFELYILMIYRYLYAKEKHSLDVEGVYNM